MATALTKGVLIAVEGIDGAGKTTQTRILSESLGAAGFRVSVFKEPTSGQWGQKIRELALNGRHRVSAEEELDLFVADRRENVSKNILPALWDRRVVLMDRYYFSSIAYQGALGLDPLEIRKQNEEFAPVPDVVVLLDVTPRIGIARIQDGRGERPNHFEGEQYLEKVRQVFRRLVSYPDMQEVDASPSIPEVASRVHSIALDTIRPFRMSSTR